MNFDHMLNRELQANPDFRRIPDIISRTQLESIFTGRTSPELSDMIKRVLDAIYPPAPPPPVPPAQSLTRFVFEAMQREAPAETPQETEEPASSGNRASQQNKQSSEAQSSSQSLSQSENAPTSQNMKQQLASSQNPSNASSNAKSQDAPQLQKGNFSQTRETNGSSSSRNLATTPNSSASLGAVFSPLQKERMQKEVLTASFLLQKQGDGKTASSLETLKSFAKLETLAQTLKTLEQSLKNAEGKAVVESRFAEIKSQMEEILSKLPSSMAEEIKKEIRTHASLEKQLSTLRQKAEQMLTSMKHLWNEKMEAFQNKKEAKAPPAQPTPPSQKEEVQKDPSQKQEKTGAASKQPEQISKEQESKTSSREAKESSNPLPKEIPQDPKETTTRTILPGSVLSQEEKSQEKSPLPLLKTPQEVKELVEKMKKGELTLPATLGLVYPLAAKKGKASYPKQSKEESSEKKHKKNLPKKSSQNEQEGEEEIEQYIQPVVFIPERKMIFGDPLSQKNAKPKIEHVAPFLIGTTPIVNQQFAAWLNKAWEEGIIRISLNHEVLDLDGHLLCKTHSVDNASQIHVFLHENHLTFSPLEGSEWYPVVQISWFGAAAYCDTYGLRLPSEIERETAAGMQLPGIAKELIKFRYGFGQNEIDPSYANYQSEGSILLPVGFFDGKNILTKNKIPYPTKNAMSPYGCYDMSGNVREWTSDTAHDKALTKGGSFLTDATELKTSSRKYLDKNLCLSDVSFRVALSIEDL